MKVPCRRSARWARISKPLNRSPNSLCSRAACSPSSSALCRSTIERKNGHAHVKAMLLSATSHAIPVVAGEPAFGTWQRLIFFEMDEPKDRTVTFHVFGA